MFRTQENSLRRFSEMASRRCRTRRFRWVSASFGARLQATSRAFEVKEFDLNGDGYLDAGEFKKMLKDELWSEET